ncbi:hypothetical protein L810_0280 [Burkholderia sp. AU4i]|nr:hypothetical protein L810_0280 [Burkholderia sp. AU4i]
MLTAQSLPLHVFFVSAAPKCQPPAVSFARRPCDIPMHFIGRLPSGSGPKDRIK